MNDTTYSMSFTTGSLLHQESVKLAELFLVLNDWTLVRDKVKSENLLQSRTLSTSKKICNEVISRLKTLHPKELELLVRSDPRDQGYLLWIAVCRRYQFIADFAVEVLREHFVSLKTELQYEDFDAFFNRKAEWHPELEKIRPVTQSKLRQVLFKMMREADLLTRDNRINAAMPSPELIQALPSEHRQNILFFPAFERDMRRVAQ